LDGEDWQRFFASFARSAWRLELHPVYAMPQEAESISRWRAGERLPADHWSPWMERVAGYRASSRSIGRVHVSYLSNIQLGIIPVTERPPRGPLNTLTVYDERLVTAEKFSGAIVMRDPRDVAFHVELFRRFKAVALFGDDARERLAEWTADFRR
jgi:hypothetical protein